MKMNVNCKEKMKKKIYLCGKFNETDYFELLIT